MGEPLCPIHQDPHLPAHVMKVRDGPARHCHRMRIIAARAEQAKNDEQNGDGKETE